MSALPVIDQWTGRTIALLQDAFRMTQEQFAQHLGVSVRALAGWRARPDYVPKRSTQQIFDAALERANDSVRARFAANFAPPLSMAQPALTESSAVVAALEAEVAALRSHVAVLQQQLDVFRGSALKRS